MEFRLQTVLEFQAVWDALTQEKDANVMLEKLSITLNESLITNDCTGNSVNSFYLLFVQQLFKFHFAW